MPPLRVGFISNTDPRDPGGQSGMPYHAASALADRGCLLTHLAPPRKAPPPLPPRLRETMKRLDFVAPWLARRAALRPALEANRWIESRLAEAGVDVLLDVCASPLIFDLGVDTPIVYFSDLTTRLLRTTYSPLRARCRAYQETRERFEHGALARADRAAFASEWARRSAIVDYAFPEDRCETIPMGANVTPDDPEEGLRTLAPPRRSSLRLCIVAACPKRKRLDLAIEATERLADQGWNARLDYIGPPTPRARASRVVRCIGPLRLSSRRDRELHERSLRECHLLLLPSEAEAFGIAPCEAAHFARPSIVSAVGGLGSVVAHDESGVLMPADAGPLEYAEAIRTLAEDDDRYLRLARGAHRRAHETLNWSSWAASMENLLRSAIGVDPEDAPAPRRKAGAQAARRAGSP